jgi:hypothetical protein
LHARQHRISCTESVFTSTGAPEEERARAASHEAVCASTTIASIAAIDSASCAFDGTGGGGG